MYVCGLAASISAKVAVVNPDDVADCQIPYRLSPDPAYVTYGHVLLLISEGTWMRVPSWTKPCPKSTCNQLVVRACLSRCTIFKLKGMRPFNHKTDETYVHGDDRTYICRWSWLKIWNLSAESAFSALCLPSGLTQAQLLLRHGTGQSTRRFLKPIATTRSAVPRSTARLHMSAPASKICSGNSLG